MTRLLPVAGEELLRRISVGMCVCTPALTPAEALRTAVVALYWNKVAAAGPARDIRLR